MSRSQTSKISSALRKRLGGDDCLSAGFRYPVYKIAKMFGWDGMFDHKGKKLINTLYNTGIEYDPKIWEYKMEKLLKKSHKKKVVIISDLEHPCQAEMIKRASKSTLIICGSSEELDSGGLIDVYVDSDMSTEYVVNLIMEKI